MMKRKFVSLLLSVFISSTTFCQDIDSAITQANKTSDTNSLKLVLGFIQSQVDVNPDSALAIIELSKQGFQNSSSDLLKGKVLNRKALALVKTGETEEGFNYANTSEMYVFKVKWTFC